MTVFKFRAEDGKVALYRGASDAPFTDPRGHLADVSFHSDLDYLPFVPARTLTATLTRIATDTPRQRMLTVGAHGMGGVPEIEGFVVISGVKVPLCGTIPVFRNANAECILWTLAVDATNVYVHEQRSYHTLGTAAAFDVTVFVSSELVA